MLSPAQTSVLRKLPEISILFIISMCNSAYRLCNLRTGLTRMDGYLHAPAALPLKQAHIIQQQAGWVPEPVWTIWEKGKPARRLGAVLTVSTKSFHVF
jgi:hypothetical protein